MLERAETAYTAVVDHYAPLVRARCERELGSADSDDAVQAVFVVLWRRWQDAPSAGPALSSWLYRTTGHVVRRAQRDHARRRRAEKLAPKHEAVMEEPSSLEHDEARAVLDSALAELPQTERDAVVLSHLAGHSYADVATHLRCSKATVAGRVQQGMATLRKHFERRGCVLSLTALAALLSEEANAAVPPSLSERLHRLPAACKAGTAAAVLGANIIRWSRREVPVMKIIGSTAAALLCASGLYLWSGNTAHTQAAETVQPPTELSESDLDKLAADLDSQNVMCVRWTDPLDTWKRLRATPLGAMIPADAAAMIEGQIAGVERIEVVMDPMSVFAPDAEVLRKQQREIALAQIRGPVDTKQRAREKFMEIAAEGSAGNAAVAEKMKNIGGFPAYLATMRLICSDPAATERWENLLKLSDELRDHIAVTRSDHELRYDMRPDGITGDLAWAEQFDWPQGSDIQCRLLTKPRDPAAYAAVMHTEPKEIVEAAKMDLWIEDGRFRMRADVPNRSQRWNDIYDRCATLSGGEWNWIPANALVAGACAVHQDDLVSSGMIQGMLCAIVLPTMMSKGQTPAQCAELIDAVSRAAESVDGFVLGYVDPAGMIPSATIAMSAAAEPSAALLQAVSRQFSVPMSESSTLKVPLGFVLLEIGHRDGNLICTTAPTGIASFVRHDGEFTAESDVAASLSAGGDKPALTRFVIRTDKIIDFALPLAGAAGLPQENVATLRTASTQLREQRDGGWFVMRMDGTGMQAEAGGAAAFVAALGIAAQAGIMPTGVN